MINWRRLGRAASGMFTATSVQGAVSLSIGGGVSLAAILAGMDVTRAYSLGVPAALVSLWPLRLYYSPERVLRRKIKAWDGLVKDRVITNKRRDALKEGLLAWYATQSHAQLPDYQRLGVDPDPEEPSEHELPVQRPGRRRG